MYQKGTWIFKNGEILALALKPTHSMGVKMIGTIVQSGITETDLPLCPRQPKIQTNHMKQCFSRHWDQAANDADVRGKQPRWEV